MIARLRGIRHEDDGATLIVVLIIMTVIALVMGVILSQADTSVRTTLVLDDQASNSYAADAAGQAAVKQLQNGKFSCTTTATANTSFGSSSTPFYAPAANPANSLNAYVDCTPDTTDGVTTTGSGVTISQSNTIGYGVLTTSTVAGQGVTLRGNTPTCVAGGSVVSNADIVLAGQGSTNSLKVGTATSAITCTLTTDPTISVTSATANGCDGSQTDNNTTHFTPTPCTHAATTVPASTWKTLAPTPTSGYTATNPAPLCSGIYAAFAPGKYTQPPSTVATNTSGCGSATFYWFTPGTYYYDYSGQWSWPTTLVGGQPQNSTGTVVSSLVGFNVTDTSATNKTKLSTGLSSVTKFPGSCADPAQQNTYNGVEFVFGGSSTILPNSSGTNELCATYSATGIPVAIYGVSYDVVGSNTLSLTGGGSIRAETLCATPPCTSNSSGGSPLIASDSSGQNSVYVQGYFYAPSAPVVMTFKNNVGLLLGWGLVARSFDFTENGASPLAPFVAYRPVLHQGLTPAYTVRYVNVWTCVASSSPCAHSGTPDLRLKVLTSGSSMVILSWNHQN